MTPAPREGQLSAKARQLMRRPRTLHCPYCEGKVIFTRNEEHLDAKNCPHCGMRVERREWPGPRAPEPKPAAAEPKPGP